jgi:hypothetical protein
LIALTGLAALAAVPVTSAQAASSRATTVTNTTPTEKCPSGTTNINYCTQTCPSGTLVSNYCESCPSGTAVGDYCESCPSGTTVASYCTTCPKGTTAVGDYCEGVSGIGAQSAPTGFGWALWGAGKRYFHGPALKFHVKRGLGGPGLKSLTCTLPSGLTFKKTSSKGAKASSRVVVTTTRSTLTLELGSVGSVLVYLKNHSMVESQKLRHEIMVGKVTKLTFNVSVTDTAGKTTKLAFIAKAGA